MRRPRTGTIAKIETRVPKDIGLPPRGIEVEQTKGRQSLDRQAGPLLEY